MVSTHYTHPVDIWFHLPVGEAYSRNSSHLLIFRKKIWDTKNNAVFFPPVNEVFDLWIPVRAPPEHNNSKELVLGHFLIATYLE